MKSSDILFSSVFILISCISLYSTAETLTECGQTIYADFGTIEYKLNQTYSAGELCTFVIRSLNYSTVHYELETHGFSDGDPDAVTILNHIPGVISESASLGPPNAFPGVLLDGYGAIVLFKTNSNLGTGFKLNFNATTIGDPFPGTSVVFNNETDAQEVQLPFEANYTGPAHYSFVVITQGAKIMEPGYKMKITLSADFHVGFCYDMFRTYTFVGDGINYEGLFCDEVDYKTTYETQGLFIVGYFKGSEPTSGATGIIRWEKIRIEDGASKSNF